MHAWPTEQGQAFACRRIECMHAWPTEAFASRRIECMHAGGCAAAADSLMDSGTQPITAPVTCLHSGTTHRRARCWGVEAPGARLGLRNAAVRVCRGTVHPQANRKAHPRPQCTAYAVCACLCPWPPPGGERQKRYWPRCSTYAGSVCVMRKPLRLWWWWYTCMARSMHSAGCRGLR